MEEEKEQERLVGLLDNHAARQVLGVVLEELSRCPRTVSMLELTPIVGIVLGSSCFNYYWSWQMRRSNGRIVSMGFL